MAWWPPHGSCTHRHACVARMGWQGLASASLSASTCSRSRARRRVQRRFQRTHAVVAAVCSELWLGSSWLSANGIALALSALFVLTSGAYLEWLSALLSKVRAWAAGRDARRKG